MCFYLIPLTIFPLTIIPLTKQIYPIPLTSTKKEEETLGCGTETGFMPANASFSFLSL